MNKICLNDFDFYLPLSHIAQKATRRGHSRLLVHSSKDNSLTHTSFNSFPSWLKHGDCIVINDTKVFPARLFANKIETGAKIEILLHREIEPGLWEALARPSRKLKPGTLLEIGTDQFMVGTMTTRGRITLKFTSVQQARKIIRHFGITPLPPYIRRDNNTMDPKDRKRYQTIFAEHEGSVAAPTAGLHFSETVIRHLSKKGVRVVPITLHVGWGTFAPLDEEVFKKKTLHPESYYVPESTVETIRNCRKNGGRIIACGTTVARTLESATVQNGLIQSGYGETELFISPGYQWKQIDGLLTNFHLPKSSLFVLVAALIGIQQLQYAYSEAIKQNYRFYSYGDAMLCL